MSLEVIATLEASPEKEADAEAALCVLLTDTRLEPGVLRYDLYRDSTRPATFLMVEAYVDEAALDAHRESPHFLRFQEHADDWLAAAPTVAILAPVAVAERE